MRQRWLLNLALLVLVLGLGWWVYLDSRPQPEPAGLLAADPQSLRHIVIERTGQPRIELVRADDGWRLVSPRELRASDFHVGMIENFLQRPPSARYARSELDPAAVGLKEPRIVLTVDGASFAFGAQEPLTQRRYLGHGDEVLLVQEGVAPVLGGPWWNFIDRSLLADAAEVVALEFGDGRRLTAEQLPELPARWQEAYAGLVTPLQEGERGEPFTLVLASGERQAWQWLGGEQPKLLRPDLGLSYQMEARALQALLGGI